MWIYELAAVTCLQKTINTEKCRKLFFSFIQHLKIHGGSVQVTGSVRTSLEMAPATESAWPPSVSEMGSTAWRTEDTASKDYYFLLNPKTNIFTLSPFIIEKLTTLKYMFEIEFQINSIFKRFSPIYTVYCLKSSHDSIDEVKLIFRTSSWFTAQDTSSTAATTMPTLIVSKAVTAPPVVGMAATASQNKRHSGLKAPWSFTPKSLISVAPSPTFLCSGLSASSSKHQSNWEVLLPWPPTGTCLILTLCSWPACWPRRRQLIQMGIWTDKNT